MKALVILVLAFVAIASAQEKVKVAQPDFTVKVVEQPLPNTQHNVDPGFYRPSVKPDASLPPLDIDPAFYGPIVRPDGSLPPIDTSNNGGNNYIHYRPYDGIGRAGQ